MIGRLANAVANLVTVWDGDTAYDLGPHLTCSETEALAELFRAAGEDDLAEALMEGHSTADDEGDAHFNREENQ